MDKVNLSQKFSLFTSHWEPKIEGQVNGHHVKLAKFQGPFVRHRHENEDELFLVPWRSPLSCSSPRPR